MAIFSSDKPQKLAAKVVTDYQKLSQVAEALRALDYRIVVTIGSWDLLHIGHVRYLNKAKEQGDVLIVGADSNRAVGLYKGPLRPIIPEDERMEMVSYQSCVDFVTLIDDVNEKGEWGYELIKQIKPDVFVAVEDSYPPKQIKEIEQFCGKVVVLPRQAEKTSTSRAIQETLKKHVLEMLSSIENMRK